MNTPAEVLKKARKSAGLSLEKVAKDTKISFTTINSWERGVCVPRAKSRQKIAKYYGIDEELLSSERRTGIANLSQITENYETRPIMLHRIHWAAAESLRSHFSAADVSEVIAHLIKEFQVTK